VARGAETDPRSPMYYGELEPRPELKLWIAAYWNFRVEAEAGAILEKTHQ